MQKYRLISKKGEGTFSEVMKAQNVQNGKFVAIKCMKNMFRSIEQVNSLREIQALRRLNPHDNIIELEDVLYDKTSGRLALVFELMDMNIYELITRNRKQYLSPEYVRILMWQLMKAIHHMHSNGIFHRDIKPENVLVRDIKPENVGVMDKVLKVADFGSCRGIHTKQPFTEYISTRWYRAPECLLTNGYYGAEMDVWGVGCVLFEIVALFPLFPGTNELDQIEKVHNILGTPEPDVLEVFKKHGYTLHISFPPVQGTGIQVLLPHVEETCVDLIEKLITYNPENRPSSAAVLLHPYFNSCREADLRATQSSTLHSLSPSNNKLDGARKERRRKEANNKDKPEDTKLPQLAKGQAGKNSKVLKLKASRTVNVNDDEKGKFNATTKDFSVSGAKQPTNNYGTSKFKPSATINFGGAVSDDDEHADDDGMSADEGPFSDTDADGKEGGENSLTQSMRLGEDGKPKRRLKGKKKSDRIKAKQQQQSTTQPPAQPQQEYYHIGNAGAKGGTKNPYNQKKDAAPQQKPQAKNQKAAMASGALPSLSKTQVNKPGGKPLAQGLAYKSTNEEEGADGENAPTAGLANLMVTTQYKIARKAQKEPQPLLPAGDKDKFSP